MLCCGDEIRMTLGWICLRCGEAYSDILFAVPTCKRCKWTRPSKPMRELKTNLKWSDNEENATSDVKVS